MIHLYQNEQDKVCFKHDMDYGDFKDLARSTASEKILRDKAFNIAKKIQNRMSISLELLQWSMNILIKKLLVVQLKIKLCLTNISRRIT